MFERISLPAFGGGVGHQSQCNPRGLARINAEGQITKAASSDLSLQAGTTNRTELSVIHETLFGNLIVWLVWFVTTPHRYGQTWISRNKSKVV